MLPDVTLPAPVVTFACVIAVMICSGVTPSAAICSGLSWMFSCICCTPERVTACTPSIACRRGTTRVPSCVASSSGGSDDDTASWTTGMLPKLSTATSGARAVAGSICCAPDTACCTSDSLAFMSVPNSYWMVMMLRPSLENESYSLMPLEVLIACSSGVVMLRSTSEGEEPWSTVSTVRNGKVRSGMSSCLSDGIANAPKRRTVSTASPTMERLRKEILVSQLKGCLRRSAMSSRSGALANGIAARRVCQRAISPGISACRNSRKSRSSWSSA